MAALFALIRKELIALSRDLHGLAALFVLPVVFIIVMSMALKDVYSPRTNALAWSFINHDHGPQAQQLITRWQKEHGAPQALPAGWETALREGRLKYVISIANGANIDIASSEIPKDKKVILQTEPGLDIAVFTALKAQLQAEATRLRVEALIQRLPPMLGEVKADALDGAHVASTERINAGPRPTSVQHNVPAWLVFGMFFVVTTIAGLFITERECGALQRLHSLGVPASTQILAKILPYMLINALQAALMLSVGVWLIPLLGGDALSLTGIHWPALIVMLLAISLAAIAQALLLAALVRSQAQVSAIGPIMNILMAAIGGIMVPTFVMPPVMQHLSQYSPMNWALEGLLGILLRGGDFASIRQPALQLALLAVACLLLAILAFRNKQA